jgi:hypothetical protein
MSQFYFFAFPHPSIESIKQIRRLRLSPEDSLDLVRERLQKAHPNCFDDLETVTFYRVRHSSAPQPLRSPNVQLPNFARARYSLREIYEWIGKRDAEASLADYDPIATLFPEGPQPPEWIDIVVVTHESKCPPVGARLSD